MYSGLSYQQVLFNRRRFGANVSSHPISFRFLERVKQTVSYPFLQVTLLLNLSLFIILPILDLLFEHMPCSVWLISLISLLLMLFLFLVVFLRGHWNTSTQRMEVNPMLTILFFAITLSAIAIAYQYIFLYQHAFQHYLEPLVMVIILLLSIVLTFVFEHYNFRILRQLLNSSDSNPVQVMREGRSLLVPQSDLVVDDIIFLHQGDFVPADARLIESHSLTVNEATINGSTCAYKSAMASPSRTSFPANRLFRGTIILSGKAVASVIAVGEDTVQADLSPDTNHIDQFFYPTLPSSFRRITRLISLFGYLATVVIFLLRFYLFFSSSPVSFSSITDVLFFGVYILDTFLLMFALAIFTQPYGLSLTLLLTFHRPSSLNS